jgi:effector-binding domain-containing protein
MLRKLFYGFAAVLALFFAIGFVLPRKTHVERSVTIAAPASSVFALVSSFRQFDKWSPWLEKDPSAQVRMSGPVIGVGAKYEWAGNKNVGAGSQEIVESIPYQEVKTELRFGGFDQPSYSVHRLEADGGNTRLTWSLDADLGRNPVSHWFGLLMDRMVGPDYEKGLAKLKVLAESGTKTDFSSLQAELVDAKPQTYAYVSGSATTDPAAITKAYGEAFRKLMPAVQQAGLKALAPPLAITRRWDEKAKIYEFDAGIPVDRGEAPAGGALQFAQTYAGPALKAEHKGSYQTMGQTYELIEAYKNAYALQDNGKVWEQYVNDPATTPEAALITWIFVPVK